MHRARRQLLREIVERERVTRYLAHARDSLATTLVSIGDGVIVTDAAGRVAHPMPALLTLDLKMPRMNGFDVLSWLRARSEFKDLPAVVISSSSDDEDITKARELGARDYFVKPHRIDDFIVTIRTLQSRRLNPPRLDDRQSQPPQRAVLVETENPQPLVAPQFQHRDRVEGFGRFATLDVVDMNADPLDRKLEAYAKQPLPFASEDLAAGVWREIDRRRYQRLAARFTWHDLLARPGWAVAGLAFAFAVGAAPAFAFVKTQQAQRLARQSLHFDVFSTQTAAPVANVLASSRIRQTRLDSP